MIKRDYLLRMIEEFVQALARLRSLKKAQLWNEAAGVTEDEFRRMLGLGAAEAVRLTETELLARLIAGAPTQAVRERTLVLATLLKEAGDLASNTNQPEEARCFYLKALHLLLETLAHEDPFEWPEFVPHIDLILGGLAQERLPLETLARLMHHYERSGAYAKAEDCLFAIANETPRSSSLREFGEAFYQRLEAETSERLAEGNLPREEIAAGLAEFRAKFNSDSGNTASNQ